MDPHAKTEFSGSEPSASAGNLERTQSWNEDADPAAPFEDFTNRMLGEFRLLRLLGRGGMAEVYLADQTSLDRKVAIKILRPDMKSNDVFLKRFEREARAAASLSHPNIVQVFMVGEEQGVHYIAQEYVKGLNLREFIRRKGPPGVNLGLHFLRQMLLALETAGNAGIVHRDIKPENMLITRKGVVKVADFGLAQLSLPGDQSALELTQVGTTMGTPLYMSPEQVHGQKLDQRSDLYSVGVTCFHMLAGDPPFRGETAMSVAIQHLNEKPPKLADRRPDLPPALCQVIHKLMAKQPERRYASATAVLKDVRQIQTALKEDLDPSKLNLSGFDLEEVETEPGVWARITRWSPRQKAFGYAGVCAGLMVLAAVIGWWGRPADPLRDAAERKTDITLLNTAEDQLRLAQQSFASREDAWQAVIENFPDSADAVIVAQENLGVLYLKRLEFEKAAKVFEDMAELETGPQAKECRMKALAGQAILADLQGDPQTAKSRIRELDTLGDLDLQTPLGGYLEQLKQRYGRSL